MSKIEDREFLELAAKAEGRILKYMTQIVPGRAPEEFTASWNPLDDDGDALRLAVALKIVWAFRGAFVVIEDGTSTIGEALGYAPCEAIRRAIVRAAAEIGRSSREDHRQRVLVRMYANFSRLRTGDNTGQMMTRIRMRDDYDCAPWPQLAGGQLDAPEWMPAGAMQGDWQRECRRP